MTTNIDIFKRLIDLLSKDVNAPFIDVDKERESVNKSLLERYMRTYHPNIGLNLYQVITPV